MTQQKPEVLVQSVSPVLPVRDVSAALERYAKLGFVTNAFESDGEPFYGFVCMGPTEFHVTRVDRLRPKKNTSAMYLYVDDADAVYERWRRLDEGTFHPPRDTDYGLREFAWGDPDGNLFRVGSPLDE